MAKNKKKTNEAIGLDVQLTKSEAFIEKHWKKIVAVLLAVIVVVAGIFIYRKYMAGVEADAQNAIAQSQQAFSAEQYDVALNGDSTGALGFLKVIDQFGGTKTANLARLYAAICYANLGETDNAISMFEKFDDKGDQMVSPAAVAALGNCYVQKGDKDKGAEMLVKAARQADNDAISPLALFQAGEVYESMGKKDEALKLYQEIKDKYFRSALANDIDKYIERVK